MLWICAQQCKKIEQANAIDGAFNAQQVSAREEKKGCNDDIQNRTAATFIQSCWQEKNSKGFKIKLGNCPFKLLVIHG
jgi:hypothetical protein